MNLKKIALFTLFSTALFARSNYCIQVAEVYHFNEYNIPSRMQSVIEDFDKARIDKRGRHYILRVGDYRSYSKAKKILRKIKARRFRDAFVRRCDYIKSKIAYPKIEQEENYQENSFTPIAEIPVIKPPKKQPLPVREKTIVTPVEEKNPIQRDPFADFEDTTPKGSEYKGAQKYSYDFWKECKRCYAPLEDEKNYTQLKAHKKVQKASVIEKDNFFEKHTKQMNQEVPKLQPSDTFFGDSLKRSKPMHKKVAPIEEENIVVEEKLITPKYSKTVKEAQKSNEDDFFEGFEEIDNQEATPVKEKEVVGKKEVLKHKAKKVEHIQNEAVSQDGEADDVYDMFGIDDL